jgi:hypothetical protein
MAFRVPTGVPDPNPGESFCKGSENEITREQMP